MHQTQIVQGFLGVKIKVIITLHVVFDTTPAHAAAVKFYNTTVEHLPRSGMDRQTDMVISVYPLNLFLQA